MAINHYATLQIPNFASTGFIQSCFAPSVDSFTKEEQDAYSILSDALPKAKHDRALSNEILSTLTLYSILQVDEDAICESVIKGKYRQLALQHHPDKGGKDADFCNIKVAYDVLSDNDKRKNYDENFKAARIAKLEADDVIAQAEQGARRAAKKAKKVGRKHKANTNSPKKKSADPALPVSKSLKTKRQATSNAKAAIGLKEESSTSLSSRSIPPVAEATTLDSTDNQDSASLPLKSPSPQVQGTATASLCGVQVMAAPRSMDESSVSTMHVNEPQQDPDLPPPTVLATYGVVSNRGIYSLKEGDQGQGEAPKVTVEGLWSLSLNTILDDPENIIGECNSFRYELKNGGIERQSTGVSLVVPQSGIYVGWFLYNSAAGNGKDTITDEVNLTFVENSEGYYNVKGRGSNQFGSYEVVGMLENDTMSLNRFFSVEDLPSAPSSRPVRVRQQSVRISNDYVTDNVDPMDIADQSSEVRPPKRRKSSQTASSKPARRRNLTWDESYAKLQEYKEQCGNCLVPTTYELDQPFAKWAMHQRSKYQKMQRGEQSSMTDERIARLEELGFDWGKTITPWDESYAKLQEYKEQHGNCLVPTTYEADQPFAKWVMHQRSKYQKMQRGEQSSMTDERIARLEELGFDWGKTITPWDESYAKLQEYKEQCGNCLVPTTYELDQPFATWVKKQRSEYQKMQRGEQSYLTDERFAQLEAVGFVWNVRAENWNINYEKLVAYKEKYGSTVVKASRDLQLQRWTTTQREKGNLINDQGESLLEPEKVQLLEEIGFDFYKREVSQKVHRIEWKFMHALVIVLEEFGYTWFSLDTRYGGLLYRPDGVIHLKVDSTAVFVEIDERGHGLYDIPKENGRMIKCKDEANKNYSNVVFIRVNTGQMTEVLPRQVETVREALANIHSSKPKGYNVYYVDYPVNHVHVLESEKDEAGFDSIEKLHTKNFDEKQTRIRQCDL